MRKVFYSLTFAFVLLLAGSTGLTAFDEPDGGGTVPAHQMWLPVVGRRVPCRITHYGYGYEEYIQGVYSPYHTVVAKVDSISGLSRVGAQFEIYADKDGQSLLGGSQIISNFVVPDYYFFRYSWGTESGWPPPNGLEEGEMYYLRVMAHCEEGVYTPWTPLEKFRAYENQTYQP